MARLSAGLLMYRKANGAVQVLLVHPGGPFWVRKDLGVWSIPKGEPNAGEDLLAAAQREFTEETGFTAEGPFIELGSIRQTGGKTVWAWALEGDCDPGLLRSNTCEIEWPPRSGKSLTIPEVDRGEWFDIDAAAERIFASQQPFLERLGARLGLHGANA